MKRQFDIPLGSQRRIPHLEQEAEAEPQSRLEVRSAAQTAAQDRYRLSSREFEVWLQLPQGLTNNQIGERLFISGKTASVHVTNILRKLGVKSRVQAITLAHQLGLVEPRSPVTGPTTSDSSLNGGGAASSDG